MQRITSIKSLINSLTGPCGYIFICQLPGTTSAGRLITPRKKPINAKGIAKMVWENFMREK
jgi:hypothetical protein